MNWVPLPAVLVLLLAPIEAQAQERSTGKETIFKRLLRSTVFVMTPIPEQSNRVATGSGSLVGTSSRGNPVILTNYHVIAPSVKKSGAGEVRVMFPVREKDGAPISEREKYLKEASNPTYTFRGKVLAYLKEKDLSLVEILVDKSLGQQLPRGTQYIPLASRSPEASSTVHTLGNTGAGGMWNYTKGEVRSVYVKEFMIRLDGETVEINSRVVETSNPTNRGDSGGPLANDEGELIGVTQGGAANAQLVSTFIDIQEVKKLLALNKIVIPRRAISANATASSVEPKKSDSTAGNPTAHGTPPTPTVDPRERDAESKLRNARRAITRDKDTSLAESFINDILRDYSDTKAATEAKSLLEEIKKKK